MKLRRRGRARIMTVAAGIAAGTAIATIAIAACSSDPKGVSPTSTSAAVGIAPVASGASTSSTSAAATTAPTASTTFTRTLLPPGTYTCAALGQWQPYPDLQLVVSVGEATNGEVCANDVVQFPAGYCASASCSQVPGDWKILTNGTVPLAKFLAVVTPIDTKNSTFYCFYSMVAGGKQTLASGTPVTQACAGATSNSVDIPYVPPPTNDIPYVPPATNDIPSLPSPTNAVPAG